MTDTDNVTTTVTSGAQPASDTPTVGEFMSAVVAWPGPNDLGHVGLWFSMPNQQFDPAKPVDFKNKPTFMTGWPFKDVDQFAVAARRMNEQPERYKHVYFCTSRQGKQGVNKRGNPKAQKSAADALYQKSIFIDIDIEPNNPKHYATHKEAWDEFVALRKKVGLPAPSAVVNTGGGLHIYWISKTPLLPHEWQPYANGLKQLLLANNFKFDAACTGDIVRLLRVPGTSNHKYDPPKETQLLPLPLVMYDFAAELALLKQFAGPTVTAAPKPGFSQHKNFMVNPIPVFEKCGFYREALRNHGADHNQPQRNLAIFGTTFMEKGGEIAHKISSGHSTYTEAETQAMYDRKVAERASSGVLGYPSCKAIAGVGCEACKTCPLNGKVNSPLNIRPTATPNLSEEPVQNVKPPSADPNAPAAAHVPSDPIGHLMALQDQGADIGALLSAMNEAFAVTKYGGQVVIASLCGDISFITVDDFHRMFANLVIFKQAGTNFGVTPKLGNWTLLRSHMLKVVCSGNQHFIMVASNNEWAVPAGLRSNGDQYRS